MTMNGMHRTNLNCLAIFDASIDSDKGIYSFVSKLTKYTVRVNTLSS